ncbi:hypothetical protein BGZ93_009982 [Podila epicladia]|nr:hypothetical protein BGZ93_009982 [Podila epicladia]
MIKNRTAQFMSDIPIYLPALREVDMDVQNSDANVLSAFIQDPHLQLSSVSLRDLEPELFTSFLNPLLRPVRSSDSSDFLRCALVRLTTRGGPLALSHVLDVLATCPNLQDLAIYNIGGYGPKSEIRHPWVCQLRSLTLGFNKFSYGPNDEPADVTACMLMEHLGKQILLQRLLVYYVEEARNSSCFPMELNLESQNGLTQLSRLSNLESFSLLGVDHHMERSEIDWMAVHWPRLRIMEVSPMNAVDENGPIDQDQYAERLSSYWPTFPRLNIDIVDWY